ASSVAEKGRLPTNNLVTRKYSLQNRTNGSTRLPPRFGILLRWQALAGILAFGRDTGQSKTERKITSRAAPYNKFSRLCIDFFANCAAVSGAQPSHNPVQVAARLPGWPGAEVFPADPSRSCFWPNQDTPRRVPAEAQASSLRRLRAQTPRPGRAPVGVCTNRIPAAPAAGSGDARSSRPRRPSGGAGRASRRTH